MDRQEAVLRELNLYPLWQRRASVGANLFAQGDDTRRVDKRSASTNPATDSPPAPENVAAVASVVAPNVAEVNLPKVEMVDALRLSTLPSEPESAPVGRDEWATLRTQIADCQRCPLHAGCLQTVCGSGDEQPDWLLVGDWSSEEDDVQGLPFQGATGKLLDNILFSIGLNRQEKVYLTNVLKCRPPEDHHGVGDAQRHCLPYLHQQIALLRPQKILALGATAAHALLGGNAPLKDLRGSRHDYQGIPLYVTYHPAYLLRSPLEKAQVWQDLCFARTATPD